MNQPKQANPKLKVVPTRVAHTPTKAEQKQVRLDPARFTLSGDGVFHTVQGEGIRQGRPTTFVRLHFCNLACTWCDTWYTWDRTTTAFWTEPRAVSAAELHAHIQAAQREKTQVPCQSITWTGGEPLLHGPQIEAFVKAYPQYSQHEIETNGTVMPSEYLLERACFNVSPKLPSSGNALSLARNEKVLKALQQTKNPCFKFVCSAIEDLQAVEDFYGDIVPREHIWIMPEGDTLAKNQAACARLIDGVLARGWSFTVRSQNVIWGSALRAV